VLPVKQLEGAKKAAFTGVDGHCVWRAIVCPTGIMDYFRKPFATALCTGPHEPQQAVAFADISHCCPITKE
jgi:hypothetical protein